MEDLVRTVRYLTDPAHHAEVVELAAKFTKQPASNFADWLFTKKDFYRDPNLMPDVGSLQRSFDLQADLGYVKQRVDAGKHTDLSMLNEALARAK
jgi:NitT/TauT family transport system substrate-binding protein